MNYCVDCKYIRYGFTNFCSHPKHTREPAKDPVTGENGFRLTGGGFTAIRHKECRDLRNVDDDCDLFEPKEVDAES